jgi:hypothetical protein
LNRIFGRLDELIDLPSFPEANVQEQSPSMTPAMDGLRRGYAASRSKVRAYLEGQIAEVRNGRVLVSFFTGEKVNPIAQRLFLIRMFRNAFIAPFTDLDDGGFLSGDGGRVDLDGDGTKKDIERVDKQLAAAANRGLFGVFSSENTKFLAAKRQAKGTYERLSSGAREELQRFFWRAFEEELRKAGMILMDSFRRVSEVAHEASVLAEQESARFLKDPGSFPDSQVAEFYLDVEVLRDDRAGERLWDLFYEHHLNRSSFFKVKDIFEVITEAFQPAKDRDGRPKAREASEIVTLVRERLQRRATELYGLGLESLQMDLARALDMEQRYIVLRNSAVDLVKLRSQGKFDDALEKVSVDTVRSGMQDKIGRVFSECAILATLDEAMKNVKTAMVAYAGLAPRFDTGEADSLGAVVRRIADNMQVITGWDDPDSLVMYRAELGMPIYYFRNVQTQLLPSYRKVSSDRCRTYPLHVEAAWEPIKGRPGVADQPGLPDLDPLEIKKLREEEVRQREEKCRRDQRASLVRSFVLCVLVGTVVVEEGQYFWSFSGSRKPLGKDRAAAIDGFEALDPTVREMLVEPGTNMWKDRTAERGLRQKLKAELEAYVARLKGLLALALVEERDAEQRFIKEEMEYMPVMLRELGG